tara:strand:- start:291 stop:989 length:699 start_codon:yes stop_codon:yes gene_type:complete
MKKLNYLLKSGANLNLIKSYLIHSFKSHFNKKKRKDFIQDYKEILKQKKITDDYFSRNTFDWILVLKDYINKKFDYLEIGSLEGNSAIFVLENFENCYLNCVDCWEDFNQEVDGYEGHKNEENFDYNLKQYSGRFRKNKVLSDLFFKKNDKFYDVIFIDGSHFADDVFKDCKNSWSILKKNGTLILDDYFWTGYENLQHNPAFAINKFLKQINHEYKIIKLTKFQLYLKKIN